MNTTLKIFQHMAGIAEGHASLSFDELSLYASDALKNNEERLQSIG